MALGGHALLGSGEPPSLEAQTAALRRALSELTPLAAQGGPLVLTHGNGPQVGHALARVEAAEGRAYPLPLSLCVAQTQAEVGFLVAQELERHLRRAGSPRAVACLLTRVEVDPGDPRLARPTKRLGTPVRPPARPGAAGEDGLRLVASPLPLRVLEAEAVAALVAAGSVVIAGGGGGIPVVADARGGMEAVDAVVDKDATSTVLALALRLPRILNLTGVDAVRLRYGTPEESVLRRLSLAQARSLLTSGAFEAGSMQPKIEAAVAFLEGGGARVDVTCPGRALDALAGRAGTRIERTG